MQKLSVPTQYLSSMHSYKENRLTMKNGFLVSCLVMFKSTISVGMLNNQMYYFGSGWFLGILITIAVTFLISYGMILIFEVAQDIEKNNENVKIDTFESISLYVTKSERSRKIWYIGKGINWSVQVVCVYLQSSGRLDYFDQPQQIPVEVIER